jgi:hypothetical protein
MPKGKFMFPIIRNGKEVEFKTSDGEVLKAVMLDSNKGAWFFKLDKNGSIQRVEKQQAPITMELDGESYVYEPKASKPQSQSKTLTPDKLDAKQKKALEKEVMAFEMAAKALFKKLKAADIEAFKVPLEGTFEAVIRMPPSSYRTLAAK